MILGISIVESRVDLLSSNWAGEISSSEMNLYDLFYYQFCVLSNFDMNSLDAQIFAYI